MGWKELKLFPFIGVEAVVGYIAILPDKKRKIFSKQNQLGLRRWCSRKFFAFFSRLDDAY